MSIGGARGRLPLRKRRCRRDFDAITPLRLGSVEGAVGDLDDVFQRAPVGRELGDADRHGHGTDRATAVRYVQTGDASSDLLGARRRRLARSIGKNDGELFSAVPAGDVFSANVLTDLATDRRQKGVAGGVAESVV